MEQPQASLAELAELVSRPSGKAMSIDAVRQLLPRARQRFARLLANEGAATLQPSDGHQLADELSQLGLLDYCRSALSRRQPYGQRP